MSENEVIGQSFRISIIVAVYNNFKWLEMIFAALEKQSFCDFEVLIADDGSSDEMVVQIKELIINSKLSAQHIWHEDKGWRKNIILNKAVVAAKSEYLVFLDGDCIPESHFVEDHYRLRERNIVVAGRRVQLPQSVSDKLCVADIKSNFFERRQIKMLFSGERHSENVIRISNPFLRSLFLRPKNGLLLGCNFGIFKDDLLKVNGFDERFLSPATGEDTDLEARLSRIGIMVKRYKFICVVYHRKHKRMEIENDPNGVVFDYNNTHGISFTPYGIIQAEL